MRRLVCWLTVGVMAISSVMPVSTVFAQTIGTDTAAYLPETVVEITDTVGSVPVADTPSATDDFNNLPNLESVTLVSEAPTAPLTVQPSSKVTTTEDSSGVNETLSIVVVPQPIPLPSSPIIITGYQANAGRLNYVQIYNNSNDLVKTDGWSFVYAAGDQEFEFNLPDSWLLSKKYAVLAWSGESSFADAEYSFEGVSLTGSVLSIELIPPADLYTKITVVVPVNYNSLRMQRYISSSGNYTTNTTFSSFPDDVDLLGYGLYSPSANTNVRVVEVLPNSRNCSPIDDSLSCGDYVKLFNPTDEPISLQNLRLRSGYKGQFSSVSNTIKLEGFLLAGEYMTVSIREDNEPLAITNTGGFVWIEDTYGLTIHESTVIEYPDSSADKYKGQSWALDSADSLWKWGIPSPYAANEFAIPEEETITLAEATNLKPCSDDQYRSEETNRCRNISSSSGLALCKEGQYRNEETNRCRSVSATAGLALCRDDQYRSEETNRCRNVTVAASSVKPCKDNQYRSEETNRCRNIIATVVPEAAFAVEPIADTGEAFMGWWALGGVGALALVYAGWEWRSEVMSGVRKVGSFFTSGK